MCAECGEKVRSGASLDRHARVAGHDGAFCCVVCSARFPSSGGLRFHDYETHHNGFGCSVENCDFAAYSNWGIERHQRDTHKAFLWSRCATELTCHQCDSGFGTRNDLTRHANDFQHKAFVCNHPECESTFTRYPDLQRHSDLHATDATRHPCTLCKRHRGATAFKRKDHLTQHLRNYHLVEPEEENRAGLACPKEGCPEHRDSSFFKSGHTTGYKFALKWNFDNGEPPFRTQSALTKHLKKEHDESPFPCDVPLCDRVGGKGFTRKRDLFKHRQMKHPEYREDSTSGQGN
jgi:hypothetical protein